MNHRKKYLHNHLAESTLLLPLCSVVALVLWLFRVWSKQPDEVWDWVGAGIGLTLMMLTMLVVTETTNTYQIIRARTRSAAAIVVLLLSLQLASPMEWSALVPALLMSISYALIFRSYQQHEAPGSFFYATLFLSVASLYAPILLVLFPAYLFYQTVFMRAMSQRTLMAGLLGVALPYLAWLTGCFLIDEPCRLIPQVGLEDLWQQSLLQASFASPLQGLMWGCLGYYSVVGVIHYWRANYSDKIRTRQMCYVYVCQTVLANMIIFFDPSHVDVYTPILVVSMATLLAHYLTLTRSRWALFQGLICTILFLYLMSAVL